MLQVEQHDHEEEEHHDRARVNDDLQRGQEGRLEKDVHHSQREEARHQRQRAYHRVAVDHHQRREDHGHGGEEKEDSEFEHRVFESCVESVVGRKPLNTSRGSSTHYRLPTHNHPFAINHATTTTFTTAIGRNTFQPSRISRSYLRRGIVQRTQTKTSRQTTTFPTKKAMVSSDDHHVPGSFHQGMSQPPKKSVTVSSEIAAMAMYSDMTKGATLMDAYSVWYPATSSESASAKSNGSRWGSAKAETMKTIIDIHMAGQKQFQAGILRKSNRTKVPRWDCTTSVRRSEPPTISAETAESVSASSYEIICAEARMPPKSEYLLADDQPAVAKPYTLSEARAKITRMPALASGTMGLKVRGTSANHVRPKRWTL